MQIVNGENLPGVHMADRFMTVHESTLTIHDYHAIFSLQIRIVETAVAAYWVTDGVNRCRV